MDGFRLKSIVAMERAGGKFGIIIGIPAFAPKLTIGHASTISTIIPLSTAIQCRWRIGHFLAINTILNTRGKIG